MDIFHIFIKFSKVLLIHLRPIQCKLMKYSLNMIDHILIVVSEKVISEAHFFFSLTFF